MTKPVPLARQLIDIGVKRSYAYQIARGDRRPSLPLALKIRRELGLKLGPIANVSEADIPSLERAVEAA